VRMSLSSSGSATPAPQAKKMPRIENKTAGESIGSIAATIEKDIVGESNGISAASEIAISTAAVTSSNASQNQGVCWQWTKFGKCKYGTACQYAHNMAADAQKPPLHMRRRLGDVDLVPDWKRSKTTETAAPTRAANFGLREECGLDLPLFEDSDLGAYIDSSLLKGETIQIAEAPQVETEAEVDPYLDVEMGSMMERKDDLGEERAAAFRQAFEELPEADET